MRKFLAAGAAAAGALGASACTTVTLEDMAGRDAVEAVSPGQAALRRAAADYAADLTQAGWVAEVEGPDAAARQLMQVLVRGWSAEPETGGAEDPLAAYVENAAARAGAVSIDLDVVIASDADRARQGAVVLVETGEALIDAPPRDRRSLKDDVLAVELAMMSARRARDFLAAAVDSAAVTSPACDEALAAYDAEISRLAALADALNDARSAPLVG